MIRLFLDSADIDEIRNVYSLITLDGVTTNPSILAESRNKYGSPILALKVIKQAMVVLYMFSLWEQAIRRYSMMPIIYWRSWVRRPGLRFL